MEQDSMLCFIVKIICYSDDALNLGISLRSQSFKIHIFENGKLCIQYSILVDKKADGHVKYCRKVGRIHSRSVLMTFGDDSKKKGQKYTKKLLG